MKITNIKNEGRIYIVTFTPTWLESLFGAKGKVEKYKDTYENYTFGGGAVYVNQSGEELGNRSKIGRSIDQWRRKF